MPLTDPKMRDAVEYLIAHGLTVEEFRATYSAYRTERHQEPTWTCERCGGHGYFQGTFKPFRYEYQYDAFKAKHADCRLPASTVLSALGFEGAES